jgi:cell division protease FtsH
VDAEARLIVDECHERALDVLQRERPRLDRLAAALLARETLGEADAYEAAGVTPPPKPVT